MHRMLKKVVFGLFLWSSAGNANIPYATKYPVLLPRKHPVTMLIIQEAHHHVQHNAIRGTLTEVWRRVWIVKARSLVRSLIHCCVICRRFEGGPSTIGGLDWWIGPVDWTGNRFVHWLQLSCACAKLLQSGSMRSTRLFVWCIGPRSIRFLGQEENGSCGQTEATPFTYVTPLLSLILTNYQSILNGILQWR